jgi:hypothetical protein
VKPTEPLLRNGSVNKPLVRQWLSGNHLNAVKDKRATINELLKAVFPVWSVPRLYIYIRPAVITREILSSERAPHMDKTMRIKQL